MILFIILPLISCLISFLLSNPQILFFSSCACVIIAGVFAFFAYLANRNGAKDGSSISEILFIYFAVWGFLFYFIWKLLGE